MKVFKTILLACVLVLLSATFNGCTGSRVLPNQLYDYFSSGDFTANYWVRGGNVLPYLQNEQVYKGKYAIEFSDLTDDEISMMFIDLNVEEDAVIRFYVNLSEERGGVFRFYIDDTVAGQWEMQTDWKRVIRELPAGEHRLKWEYESYSDDPHKVWLDDIMVSNLIPLGEKIDFADNAFKQLVLAQIGKSGGDAAPYKLSESLSFQDSREEQTLNKHISLFNNSSFHINKHARYSNDEVYVNEVRDIERLMIQSYLGADYPVADITGVEHFSNLMYLFIIGPYIEDMTPLSELENIRNCFLALSNIEDMTPLNTSAEKGSLETLAIMNNMTSSDQLTSESIDALGTWSSLKQLFLMYVDISDADVFSNLFNLETLILDDLPITDISPLSELSQLTQLSLAYSPVVDIRPLSFLNGLKDLVLDTLLVTDVSPLESLTGLETLGLWDLPLDSLDGLGTLVNLEELSLETLAFSDISPLASLMALEQLYVRDTNVKDISAVKNLTNVIWMDLRSNLIEDIIPIADGLISTLERLDIRDNQLDLTPGSEDMINIQKLLDAGVDVRYE